MLDILALIVELVAYLQQQVKEKDLLQAERESHREVAIVFKHLAIVKHRRSYQHRDAKELNQSIPSILWQFVLLNERVDHEDRDCKRYSKVDAAHCDV